MNETQWWWFSFCDTNKLEGSQFLGACIVPGDTFEQALVESYRLGINPGGEVQGQGPCSYRRVFEEYRGRLLSKTECAQLNKAVMAEDADGQSGQTLTQQVSEFSVMIGAPVRFYPQEPSGEETRLRCRLVLEEAFELLAACIDKKAECTSTSILWADRLKEFERHLFDRIIDKMPIEIDLVAATDACADIDYVVEGTRLAMGVDGEPIAALVHASNMAKVGGTKDENGKFRKPAGWLPPDIRGELVRQGWSQCIK